MTARHDMGPMPLHRRMVTVDERLVHAPLHTILALAADVERWPERLAHYRSVRFVERRSDGSGIVEMAANRPFGPVRWPTWWMSEMQMTDSGQLESSRNVPVIRYRHIRGITTGMDVEWQFAPAGNGTRVRVVHMWNGPALPLIGGLVARTVIGPVFVHGIASRTLAGLARVAERMAADAHAPR
jgi:ribosome-associated toxin RatA of RatAB toxin-antitoxin module